MRRALVLPVALVAAALLGAPGVRAAPRDADAGRDVVVERLQVAVAGQRAEGYLAYPRHGKPTRLLVYGHGCCGPRAMARVPERLAFAAEQGAVVVAMDYRGRGGWDVAAGAADVVAATELLQRRFPIRRTVAWGHSMGAEVTGMAVAARPELFDWWVGTAGVYDLVEQWWMVGFRRLIEAETGGTPLSHPTAYRTRSPVELAHRMRGLDGVVLVHGAADPVVLQTQAWRMLDALQYAGVPARMELVPFGDRLEGPALRDRPTVVGSAPVAPGGHDGSVVARSATIVARLLARR